MRVIHILPHSLEPFVPGLATTADWQNLEHHLTRFIEQLQTADSSTSHELWTLSRRATQPFDVWHANGFKIRVFPTDWIIFLPLETSMNMLKAVWRETRQAAGTIWHLHAYYLWMYDWLAILLAGYHQPFVAHHRGGAFTLRALPYSLYHYGLALPLTLRLAKKVFVQNIREKRRLARWYRLPAHTLMLTPNCAETVASQPRQRQAGLRLIYVGRMIGYKGVLGLIDCAQALHLDFPALELHLVGDGDLLPSLRAAAEPWLHLPGPLAAELVRQYLLDSDIFLFGTTKSEGSPQALIEAQAAGLPAVAFACEGAEDVISNNQTGFLVNSWPEFAAKLRLLLGDQALRERLGQAAAQRVAEHFLCRPMSDQVISVYRHLASQISRKTSA